MPPTDAGDVTAAGDPLYRDRKRDRTRRTFVLLSGMLLAMFPGLYLVLHVRLGLSTLSLAAMAGLEALCALTVFTIVRRTGPLAVYANGIGFPYALDGPLFVPFADIESVDPRPPKPAMAVQVRLKDGSVRGIPAAIVGDRDAFVRALAGKVPTSSGEPPRS
jgi:hypothetical protein